MKLVFIGGIHGAGKTTAARLLAEHLGGSFYSAGELIRSALRNPEPSEDKRVADPAGNQALLISEFLRVKNSDQSSLIILDGHFVLTDRAGNITPIAVDVFRQLGVTDLLCIVDNIEAIRGRLVARDGRLPTGVDLDAMQQSEIARATDVAKQIGTQVQFLSPAEVASLRSV